MKGIKGMYIDSILLGIIQGVTEFLPVSSSAHIVILETLLGRPTGDLLLGLVLHLGTLLAVCVLFYADLLKMITNFFKLLFSLGRNKELWIDPHTKLIGHILLATLVTGCLGLLFKSYILKVFESTFFIGILLIINGTILFWNNFNNDRSINQKDDINDNKKNNKKNLELLTSNQINEIKPLNSLLIGFFQSLAILPGISRSGITITTGIKLGLNRETAGRFSYLISVPTILGGFILEISEVSHFTSEMLLPLCVGGFVSFLVGIYSLKILVDIISKGNISVFSGYCWALGIVLLLFSF